MTAKALKDLVAAWESLPSGNYNIHTLERWLKDVMAPAVQASRVALKAPSKINLHWDKIGADNVLRAGIQERSLARIRSATGAFKGWEGEMFLPIVYQIKAKKYDDAKSEMELLALDFLDQCNTPKEN